MSFLFAPTQGASSATSPARASTEQLRSMAAVPSALASLNNRRARKRGKNEKDLTLGNDSTIPWLKTASGLKTYSITQTLEPSLLFSSSTTVPTYVGKAFVASDVDNFSAFAGVFDQYRIDMIEVLIQPNVTEVTASSGGFVGNYISTVDVDDASTPATLGQLGGYANCQESGATMAHYHRWVPQYAVATYSGTFTSYSAATGWVDCGSPNVQYYGLKAACTAASGGQAISFYLTTRYHITFRSSH